jgi:hypothetical protein
LLLLSLLAVREARGETHCRSIAGGSAALEQIDANVRLKWIDKRLRHGARNARMWAWGWAGIYSGIVTYELITSGVVNKQADKNDAYIGAAASTVGVLVLAIAPLDIMRDQRWLERRLKNAKPGTDPCALLADAERLLLRDAKGEDFGTSPLIHAGSFIFNVGVGLVLGLGFNHWTQAAATAIPGIVIGELQAFTQPMDAVHDLAHYRAGALDAPTKKWPLLWSVVPTVGKDQYGLQLALGF